MSDVRPFQFKHYAEINDDIEIIKGCEDEEDWMEGEGGEFGEMLIQMYS